MRHGPRGVLRCRPLRPRAILLRPWVRVTSLKCPERTAIPEGRGRGPDSKAGRSQGSSRVPAGHSLTAPSNVATGVCRRESAITKAGVDMRVVITKRAPAEVRGQEKATGGGRGEERGVRGTKRNGNDDKREGDKVSFERTPELR